VTLALCFLAAPLAAPGVAAAAPASVTPVLECIAPDPAGGFIAVLGYSNPSSTSVTVPRGAKNKFTPTRYDGAQPTTFLPGRQRGVFSVRITHPHVKWMLQGTQLVLVGSAPTCPPSTEMPGSGNGTGPAIGLLAAGVVGLVMARRMTTRLSAVPRRPVQNADHA
jgi:hypothetical protein